MYKEVNVYLNILKKMCEANKSSQEILNYINSFDQKLRMDLFINELKGYDKNIEFVFGSGDITSKIMFIYQQPSERYWETGEDTIVKPIIESLCQNSADRINPIFDKENIYETFFIKNKDFLKKGFYLNAIKEEISIVQPEIVVCFGQELCNLLIHPNYDMKDTTIYNDNPKYIGCPNIYDINQNNAIDIKTNIWDKLNLFKLGN